jgi:hypothetical protein
VGGGDKSSQEKNQRAEPADEFHFSAPFVPPGNRNDARFIQRPCLNCACISAIDCKFSSALKDQTAAP